MSDIIVGYGEIGKAVAAVVGECHVVDPAVASRIPEPKQVDVMHVCFGYYEHFVEVLKEYIEYFKPKHIVIYSTLPIGTTKEIPYAVHSPVEGKHPELEMSLRFMQRWVGYNDEEEAFFFAGYFEAFGLKVKTVENSDFTEALKLLSTTEYGVNLLFADYKARVADELGMNYQLTKDWNQDYNELYKNLGMAKRFQKFVLDAPNGKIGGHCIVPNANILNMQFPDEIVRQIGNMG